MTQAINLVGQKFGRLVVVARAGKTRHGNLRFRCRCVCGARTVVASGKLRRGHTRSCGCLLRDMVAKFGLRSRLRHGHTSGRKQSRAYSTWYGMIQRCRDEDSVGYKHYGGRGIKVCKRWHRFENWLADMGFPPPGKQIDRIDNDGDYKPSNCRWVTPSQNLKNRRRRRG